MLHFNTKYDRDDFAKFPRDDLENLRDWVEHIAILDEYVDLYKLYGEAIDVSNGSKSLRHDLYATPCDNDVSDSNFTNIGWFKGEHRRDVIQELDRLFDL